MRALVPVVAVVGILILPACGPEPVCDAGDTQRCLCPAGTQGAQSCADDGQSWGDCSCDGVDDDDDVSDDDDATDDDDSTDDGWPDEATLGDERTCAEPVDGFDRLEQVTEERGLAIEVTPMAMAPCVPLSGGVFAEDLDGDGDVDALLQNPDGFPHLFENDGAGYFTEHTIPFDAVAAYGRRIYGHSIVDLDDDRLPEVVLAGPDLVLAFPNLGELAFGDPEVLFLGDGFPRGCVHAVAFGDADGDLDLDLYIARADELAEASAVWEPMPPGGAEDLLIVNEGGDWVEHSAHSPVGGPAITLLATFTDRDGDGDQDILSPIDRPYGYPGLIAFHDNRGGLQFEDVAPEIGFALAISGMGIATTDFNHDGRLDYCLTDEIPDLRCLTSLDGGDSYLETGLSMGLSTDPYAHPEFEGPQWEGWSVELVDLDNDGWLDAASTAGEPNPSPSADPVVKPTALWLGRETDGPSQAFDDVSAQTGFNLGANHYGMAAADFEGDGFLDLLIGPYQGQPVFWSNPCGDGAWLQVDLVGLADNPRALGALVTAEWGAGRRDVQEVQGSRGLGQSPALRHFGLGDVESVDRVEIRWPDGATTTVRDVPVRRTLTVTHPDGG